MLGVKPKIGLFTVATFSFSLVATSAQAVVLFSESQTGIELFNNPDVTFPSVAPVINGSSIDFGTGTDAEALLVWDLLPAAPRGDLDIYIDIDYTPLTGDNDPMFTMFDGSNYLGLSRIDNNGGEVRTLRGTATNTALLSRTVDATPFIGIGPVEPFSYDLWIADGGAGPASVNNLVEGANSAAGPFPYLGNFVDTDNALSFAIYRPLGFSAGEEYRINSIAITIEDKTETVPEPSMILGTLAALGLGLISQKLKRGA